MQVCMFERVRVHCEGACTSAQESVTMFVSVCENVGVCVSAYVSYEECECVSVQESISACICEYMCDCVRVSMCVKVCV